MKNLLLLLLLFSFFQSFSQEKKIIYTNENLDILSKDEYTKNPLNKYFFEYKTENDSLIIYTKVKTEKVGRISLKRLNLIRNKLYINLKREIDSLKTIIINYYPGQDKCNKSGDKKYVSKKYLNFAKKIKKKKNVIQFFIYKDKKGLNKYSKKINWFPDHNNLIERTFFKFHYSCGSSVIIKSNGNYLSIRGEHDILRILDIL